MQTMLETCAVWLEGTTAADMQAIKFAIEGPAKSAPTSRAVRSREGPRPIARGRPSLVPKSCHWNGFQIRKCMIIY